MPFRILAIDDDPQMTCSLKKLLTARGYAVREENDSTKALQAAHEFQPQVCILDFLMPTCHGGDVAWQFWSDPRLRKVRVIVCTSADKEQIAWRMPPRVIPIFEKPFDTGALLTLLEEWAGEADA